MDVSGAGPGGRRNQPPWQVQKQHRAAEWGGDGAYFSAAAVPVSVAGRLDGSVDRSGTPRRLSVLHGVRRRWGEGEGGGEGSGGWGEGKVGGKVGEGGGGGGGLGGRGRVTYVCKVA